MAEQQQGCQGHHCSPDDDSSCIKVYQAVVFVMPVLFTVILIVVLWFIHIRGRRNVQEAIRLRQQFLARSLVHTTVERGLCKILLDTLPVALYDDILAASLSDCRCPVCLNDFKANDTVRQLPVCGHCFHLDCIDEWILSNSTCPMCRSTLIVTKKTVPFNSLAQQAAASAELSETEGGTLSGDVLIANDDPITESVGISDHNAAFPKVDGAANV